MRRVLLVNDTEKPIGQLRQALLDAGYEVLDEVAAAPALLKAVSTQQPDVVTFASAPCRSGFSRDERSLNVSVSHNAPKSTDEPSRHLEPGWAAGCGCGRG